MGVMLLLGLGAGAAMLGLGADWRLALVVTVGVAWDARPGRHDGHGRIMIWQDNERRRWRR